MMFTRCTAVAQVSLFLDVQLDESYTPEVVSLRAGNRHHDLREIRRLHLVEPSGWVHIPVNRPNRSVMRVFMLQLAVLKNHQSGKDTHIRQVRVWAHKQDRHL
nr:Anaphase-promoting complex subunit 10 [Polyrhizophydium stewartii]